jgi:hypothetical protein
MLVVHNDGGVPSMTTRFAMLLLCAAGAAVDAFAQGCPTTGANPTSPINVNVAAGAVTFNWSPSPASGVTGYELKAGTTTGNATTVCSTNGATSCTASLSAGSYGWLVRTKFTTCPSIDSAVKNFTVGCPQTGPSLTSPTNNATNVSLNPILQWTSVADSDRYDVFLGPVGSGCTNAPINTVSGTTLQVGSSLQPNTTYEWRIGPRRQGANCPVQSSTCQMFTTTASCPPAGAFNNISPADGAVLTTTPTLTWSPSSGAAQYFVHLGQVNPPPTLPNSVSSSSTSFTPSTLGPGRYYWNVGAVPSCGLAGKVESKVFSFTINSCPTAPKLDAPDDNASVTSLVKFDWDLVAGATEYRLNAILSGSTNTTLLTTTKDTEYTATMPTGVTEWWVEAVDGATCPNAASVHRHFTVTGCPFTPPFPSLVSPANGATGLQSPVSFQWTGVAGATGYRVFGSLADSSATSTSDLFLIGSTTSATQLTAAVPKGTITWVVEARFGDCPSGVSRSSTMTVATGAACNTTQTTLLSPANNATGVDSQVTFQWAKVDGSIGYNLYVNDQLQGFTTETSLSRLVGDGKNTWRVDTLYAGCPAVRSGDFTFTAGGTATCVVVTNFQVTAPASGATVTSPVNASWSAVNGASAYRIYASLDGGDPEMIARTSSTSRSLLLPSGSIELFIEALVDNCGSIFTPHVKFNVNKATTCDAHRPVTLVSPIGGAQTNADVVLKWTATDAAAFYRVWVSMNGDPFESIGLTTDTQFERKLAPGNGTWFVESIFEGCPSVASNKETFTIAAAPRCNTAPPVLVSPADNAQNVTSPVTLIWSSVTAADDYRVFISLDNGAFVQIAETDDVTSITRALPSGSYRWYVEAVLEGCSGKRSAISRFTIARAQNCATDAPQLQSPANGATLTDAQVTLTWSPVSGAIGYVVFARAGDGGFTRIGETNATRLTHPFPDGLIEWFVVVLLNGCPSIESQHFRFTIPPLSGCDNPKPLLHSPPDHAVGVVSPVRFIWSAVPNATSYKVWAAMGDDEPSIIGTTTDTKLTINVPAGVVIWFVEGDFLQCPPVRSALSSFIALKTAPPCAPPERTVANAPGQAASGSAYNVRWAPVANSSGYELQESATADFAKPTSQTIDELFATFTHTATAAPQKWFYRVRAISNCLDLRGPFSAVVATVVLPDTSQQSVSIEAGSKTVAQKIFIPGKNPALPFVATTDKPWAHVAPSSGTIGPAGITLTITYDDAALKLGTNTATLSVTYPGALGKTGVTDVAPKTSVPVSVSTVTPVGTGGKSGPPPNSLIIPVIGHQAGLNNSLFESDVRIANTSATTMKYLLNFTLSGADGTQSGQSTTIQVAPGETMALDDILTSFFGIGADGSGATGVLEIRPLTSSTSVTSSSSVNVQSTVASSRTYNSTPTGTFGQFIPAILFSQFIGNGGGRLTLQQVAQSSAYRTNLGLTEGGGEPANVNVHVFDAVGAEVANIPVSLLPGEHKQLNSFLATNNISLQEGRFEIEVTSTTGKVTAYASTVDNLTNDPLCVFPVLKGATTSSRYVIPGVADLNSPFYSWRSDIRVFNSSTSDLTATLTYFPQTGNPAASGPVQLPIKAGEVKAIDSALQSLFGLTNSGGALVISTPSSAPLVVTARTYNQTGSGTYGQFIPAVTPAESAGLNDRTLQLIQLEQSDRFRTNIGLSETNGSPATAEVSVIVPDSKFAIKTQVSLAANEFRQFNLGTDFGVNNAYNVRVTVKVISGTGRVTAYGSMIDQITQDPTFVPPL